ncbi:hypothetical protein D5R81_04800 [Parashewanella spongiae]|uniref:Uncharacterized protein n=1 Tax=Parashewanella spongiae TaxID=342950 RepID=A0A3A6U9C4_9GAMM|nr:hypothetical protein D5R81_04800 [Parashewanella spongiae]
MLQCHFSNIVKTYLRRGWFDLNLYKVVVMYFMSKIINLLISVLPVYLMWNWVVPDIFSLPSIGFFQAAGLILLVQFLTPTGLIKLGE